MKMFEDMWDMDGKKLPRVKVVSISGMDCSDCLRSKMVFVMV